MPSWLRKLYCRIDSVVAERWENLEDQAMIRDLVRPKTSLIGTTNSRARVQPRVTPVQKMPSNGLALHRILRRMSVVQQRPWIE